MRFIKKVKLLKNILIVRNKYKIKMPSNVTVGIPTHKRPNLLKRALNSLTMKNIIDIKIIVSVDGVDETIHDYKAIENLYKKYNNIEFIFHKTNIGSLQNFIFLRDICKTKYFMWLADDDETSQELIFELYKMLESKNDIITAVPYWELYNSKNTKKIIKPSFFNEKHTLVRVFKYVYDSDDVFFYGLHRTEKIKKCSFKDYWWPNKKALSNWCYVFQMDLILQGKILLLNKKNLTWKNHDYGTKFYKRSSATKILKNISYTIRRLNIYFLYFEKFIKWKKYHYLLIFIFPFIILFLRDLIFKEPINKRIKF